LSIDVHATAPTRAARPRVPGGIDTALLARGTPEEVRTRTRSVIEQGRRHPGIVLSSCGKLYGDVPMENLLAYFETRDRMGIPAEV